MARDTFQLIAWTREVEGLSQPQAFVLLALALRADAKRQTFVGQATLAKETRAAVKTVQRAMNELARRELIRRIPRYKEGKRTSDLILVRPGRGEFRADHSPIGLSVSDLSDSDDQPEALRVLGTTPLNYSEELPGNTSLFQKSDGASASMMFRELLEEWPEELDEYETEKAREKFERHLRYGVHPQTMIEGARRLSDSGEYVPELRRWLVQQLWKES